MTEQTIKELQEERRRQVEYEQKQAKLNFFLGLGLGFAISGFVVLFYLLFLV